MLENARIVAVDDEPEIRDMLQDYLRKQGLKIETYADGAALRAAVGDAPPDLALLDINLPDEDGLSLARWLRESSDTAIIMVTAADDTIDRIVGLEMGADDYVTKPFDLRELLARIKAVLRRRKASSRARPDIGSQVPFGACWLDLDSHRLTGANGTEIPLTGMEFDLLKAFAERPNRVLTRDQLLDLAHSRDWEPFDRSIDIRISRIRRKIEADPKKPQVIKTVRGAGYVYAPPQD